MEYLRKKINSKSIRFFLSKKFRIVTEWLPERCDINEVITSARESALLRILAWLSLFFLVIAFVIGFHSQALSNPEYQHIQGVVISIATIIYIFLTFPFYEFLSDKLYKLIVPKGSKFDSETQRNANFLAIGIILCMTVMIFLLMFDYFQHSKSVAVPVQPLGADIQNNSLAQAAVTPTLESPVSENLVFLGTYGDFFGGVVNPVLTFGTLIALAITILMQRLQLRDARNETKENTLITQQQAFESTFFNLLSLHTENVKNLRFHDDISGQKSTEGRAVFAEVLNYLGRNVQYADNRLTNYRIFQKNNNDILGHYFRNLFQILNQVENFKSNMSVADKYVFQKRYANILRAQLSSHELVLLLLNCTKNTVDKGRFRDLVVKYEFLEHLPATEGDNGVPYVPELGRVGGEIFLDYFPTVWEVWRNPNGAFGKNEVFQPYIEAKRAADAKVASEEKHVTPADSPGSLIG